MKGFYMDTFSEGCAKCKYYDAEFDMCRALDDIQNELPCERR